MLRVGVIGYGYWGPNLVRNFMETAGATVVAVCDGRPERLAAARARWPSVRVCEDPSDLIEDPGVDAVAIATPLSSHYPLALQALKAGKHVLVEKPIASSSAETLDLMEQAERRRLVLMVDHTFVYTGAVRKIRELVTSGEMGDLYYYDAVRVNLGIFQHDVNVLWDLAVHDLAILDWVVPARPVAISAVALSHIPGQPENLAYLTLFFPDPFVAHINVNWLAPAKVRRTLIGGSAKMIEYNDIEPSEKVKVYDRGVTVAQRPEAVWELLVSYRTGDVWAPRLDQTEALLSEARHFVACVDKGLKPESDATAGLRVVRILEAAQEALQRRGGIVELAAGP